MAGGILEITAYGAEECMYPADWDRVPAWFLLAETAAATACFRHGHRRHAAWLVVRALTVLKRSLGDDIVHCHIQPLVLHETLACRLPLRQRLTDLRCKIYRRLRRRRGRDRDRALREMGLP